jgi:hypothetical protein
MLFPTVVLRRRSENVKSLISCPWPGVVLVASPGGTKSDVLWNVPLDDTAEQLYGCHGKARHLMPSLGFLKRGQQTDSRPVAQAIPHFLRNPNG